MRNGKVYYKLKNCDEKGIVGCMLPNMLYIDLLADVMFAETYSESIYIPGLKNSFQVTTLAYSCACEPSSVITLKKSSVYGIGNLNA